jgi:hypothetical protein
LPIAITSAVIRLTDQHRTRRRQRAAGLGLAAEQRQPVALEDVAAGQQRHRHVLHDRLGGVRAGDEGQVERKGRSR